MKDIKKTEQSLVDEQRKKLKEELMEEILRELKPYIIEVLRKEFFHEIDKKISTTANLNIKI